MAMGAIQFASLIKYIASSPRAGGGQGGYEFAIQFSMPLEELMNTYLPQFSGILDELLGPQLHPLPQRVSGRGGADPHGVRVLRCGPRAPPSHSLLAHHRDRCDPLVARRIDARSTTLCTRSSRARSSSARPSMMFFLSAFSVAVLAAEGVENVLRRTVPTGYLVTWMLGGAGDRAPGGQRRAHDAVGRDRGAGDGRPGRGEPAGRRRRRDPVSRVRGPRRARRSCSTGAGASPRP